jgi:hypothetical protein
MEQRRARASFDVMLRFSLSEMADQIREELSAAVGEASNR